MSHLLYPEFEFEEKFVPNEWLEWTAEHTEIPVFAVTAYLLFLYVTIPWMQKRAAYPLRVGFALWNLALAVFSIIGASRCVPYVLWNIFNNGFHYTVCTPALEWYTWKSQGFWTMLFIYSKIPELLDTVFLVFMKKPIIFLHWFHHCTVLLYCWHSFATQISSGIWFITMNYTVHSFMYLYFFFMMIGARSLTSKLNKFITIIQILQMFAGSFILGYAWYTKDSGVECSINWANIKMGLAMYIIYAVLFVQLFINLYIKKRPGKASSPKIE